MGWNTPISRVFHPSETHLFSAVYRGPISPLIYDYRRLNSSWGPQAHCLPRRKALSSNHWFSGANMLVSGRVYFQSRSRQLRICHCISNDSSSHNQKLQWKMALSKMVVSFWSSGSLPVNPRTMGELGFLWHPTPWKKDVELQWKTIGISGTLNCWGYRLVKLISQLSQAAPNSQKQKDQLIFFTAAIEYDHTLTQVSCVHAFFCCNPINHPSPKTPSLFSMPKTHSEEFQGHGIFQIHLSAMIPDTFANGDRNLPPQTKPPADTPLIFSVARDLTLSESQGAHAYSNRWTTEWRRNPPSEKSPQMVDVMFFSLKNDHPSPMAHPNFFVGIRKNLPKKNTGININALKHM